MEFEGFFLLPKRRLQEEEEESGIPDSTGQVDKGTNSAKIDQRACLERSRQRFMTGEPSMGEQDVKNYGEKEKYQ